MFAHREEFLLLSEVLLLSLCGVQSHLVVLGLDHLGLQLQLFEGGGKNFLLLLVFLKVIRRTIGENSI